MNKKIIDSVNGIQIIKVTDPHQAAPRYLVKSGSEYIGKGITAGGYVTLQAARKRANRAPEPKTITAKEVIETAEYIRDFNLRTMAETQDLEARAYRRDSAMSQIEGLKKVLIYAFDLDTKDPASEALHAIWQEILNVEII